MEVRVVLVPVRGDKVLAQDVRYEVVHPRRCARGSDEEVVVVSRVMVVVVRDE